MRKRLVTVTALLLFIGLLTAFFLQKRAPPSAPANSPAPTASVAPVVRGSIASSLRVAGQFIPYQEVDLHAKVSGYIRRINVDIGDRVRMGQVIATLEVPELKAQLVGAQAAVRHSQSEITRAQSEVKRAESNHDALHAAYTRLEQAAAQRPGLIAQQELDDARARDQNSEAQIEAAKAARAAMEQQLGVSQADNQRVQVLSDYSSVISPFTGVITRRYADTGALIQAGTTSNTQSMPVVRVAQSDLLRLRMPVPEADVRFLQPGSAVQVTVGALGRVFPAKIVRFTRALDPSTRTMLAEVDVPNQDLSLNAGMYADTKIVLQRRHQTLHIPSQAIVQDPKGPYVLVADADQRVVKRAVNIGIQGQNRTEITSGLSAGDLVILSGQGNYHVGELVRPQVTSPTLSLEEAHL